MELLISTMKFPIFQRPRDQKKKRHVTNLIIEPPRDITHTY